ncbi:MAG: ferritin family protein [Desulfobacteraceae bacterium]|nr:ferritin family protein [Desulfobacteraceae bacterium]
MDSQNIFKSAITYEKKIRDLYLSAVDTIDDARGKDLFKALADDEQSHVDFLEYSLNRLDSAKDFEVEKLKPILSSSINDDVDHMKKKIPKQMLGDIKRALNAALSLEIETSRFYKKAWENSKGQIKEIFKKFHEIEQSHVELVQIQLDYASKNGYWLNFMEINMED